MLEKKESSDSGLFDDATFKSYKNSEDQSPDL